MLNLRYLHDLVTDFEDFYGTDLAGFIEYMRMLDELGEELDAPLLKEAQGVVLRTCHGAKGLEYDHVFIIDLVEDKFPITSGGRAPLLPDELNDRFKDIFEIKWASDKEQEEALKARKRDLRLKEERRLAYVAYTRAKKELYLCYAQTYGEKERNPSMFIAESCYDQGNVHKDIEFIQDEELKVGEMSKDSPIEKKKNEVKRLILSTIDSEPELALYNLMLYEELSGHKMPNGTPESIRAAEEAAIIVKDIGDGMPRGLKFDPAEVVLSHSSLKTYRECPKKFELSRLLRMPSRYDDEEGDGALGFGTFVHEALELAAKNKVKSRQEIDDIASQLLKEPGYKAINVKRAKVIFDTFWERNKNKLGNVIMMEQPFSFEIDGYHFTGKIDRVDKLNGNGEVDIIDYKTGHEPSKEDREDQLLLYKLAFEHDPTLKATGLKPTNLSLELLEEEKPRIFRVDEDGFMVCINGRCTKANVAEVEKGLLDIASCIKHDYENGFEVKEDCSGTNMPGSSCEYRMYCPKWG
jgi:DNA helicase-2/ATP-dependent DNA helicase PcrA